MLSYREAQDSHSCGLLLLEAVMNPHVRCLNRGSPDPRAVDRYRSVGLLGTGLHSRDVSGGQAGEEETSRVFTAAPIVLIHTSTPPPSDP